MTEVFLGLGSNIGEREKYLSRALELIKAEAGEVIRCSSLWETEPWGFEADLSFLNIAILVKTSSEPEKLLDILNSIERRLGRERDGGGYKSRTIDIDILFWGDSIIKTNDLVIPHPAIPYRRFVLSPLEEIAPGFIHPEEKLTVTEMLSRCTDKSAVRLSGTLI